MHRILGIIATLAAALGFLLMVNMFWAATHNGGMAVLGLQTFGIIVSMAAVALGALALFLGRPEPSMFANIGLGVGLGNVLALLGAYLFF